MRYGSISLDRITEFVRSHPVVPHPKKHRDIRKKYLELVNDLLKEVPEDSGWYAWIDSHEKRAVYIGQSFKRNTSSLRARLTEEFRDECVAFWTAIDPSAVDVMSSYYNDRYKANQVRAAKKKNTNKILWITSPRISEGFVDVVELKLIQRFKPIGNSKARDYSDVLLERYSEVEEIVENTLQE